jgi:uncharacterized membrane-anchored protein
MTCRRHGSKPTIALWMLVAVADVALIVATAGVLTMLLIATALVTVGAAALGIRQLVRQERSPEAAPARVTARRRA